MLLEGIEIYNMGWCLHQAGAEKHISEDRKAGLSQASLVLAREFLDGHEFGLCLDTIVTLVCEEGIRVDEEFYQEVAEADIFDRERIGSK